MNSRCVCVVGLWTSEGERSESVSGRYLKKTSHFKETQSMEANSYIYRALHFLFLSVTQKTELRTILYKIT